MPEARTSSENVIVATPLGPNQAMKAFTGADVPVPARASQTATGRATRSVTTTIATAAAPSWKSPPSVSSDPKTTKIPSLTISMSSWEPCSKYARMSGRRMPRVMAQTNTAMIPLPCGGATVSP